MFIKNLKPNNTSVYQIVTSEFSGIGHITEHNEIYTLITPHNNQEIFNDYPDTILHNVYIPTKAINLIITIYEYKPKSKETN